MAGISFMDILFAEALASGLARQARAERPPPDNFFVLPRDPTAWRQLRDVCKREHLVIAIEVTDDDHEGSRRIQPHFVNLAREFDSIPFIRLKVGPGGTYEELRSDVGGVRFCPTIVIVFFDDDGKQRAKFEGELEIKNALSSGRLKEVIKELVGRRVKLKVAEDLVQAVAGHMSEREKKLRQEYEQRMKLEVEEKERALRQEEEQKQKIEEEKKSQEEEKERELQAQQRRADQLRRDSRPQHLQELFQMDLDTARPKQIQDIMTKMGISFAGCLSREDLKRKLIESVPELRQQMHQGTTPTSPVSPSSNLSDPLGAVDDQLQTQRDRATKAEQKVKQLEQEKARLEDEMKKMKNQLEEKKVEVLDLNSDLKKMTQRANSAEEQYLAVSTTKDIPKTAAQPVPKPRSSSSSSSADSQKVSQLETQLLETRMLYTTTIEDFDVLGLIHSSGTEGMVLRAKCEKKGIPNPDRVYAMKVLANYFQNQTATQVRTQFQNEYQVLCQIPPHENIIHMHAFFYDRVNPDVSEYFRNMGANARTMSLFLLMDEHTMSMKEHLDILVDSQGPKPVKILHWFRDLLKGLEFLQMHCVVHRDLKLDNLLMDSNGRVIISDFGNAVILDSSLKVAHHHGYNIGGNRAHLCPEVLNSRPSARGKISYTKQSVWAAGVLAYELSGHQSPFDSGNFDQRGYDADRLPPLKFTYCKNSVHCQSLPAAFTSQVRSMLSLEASDRPTLQFCLKTVSGICD